MAAAIPELGQAALLVALALAGYGALAAVRSASEQPTHLLVSAGVEVFEGHGS